jgi:site-specific DNA-adenine methylase
MRTIMKTKKLRPPFKIHGGKAYLCQWIISNFPAGYEKLSYLEPFGGAGSVLLNKNQSVKEVYNDLHQPTANIFHCLTHNSAEMLQRIWNIVYSEGTFEAAKEIGFQFGSTNSAIAELVLRRMSRGGMKKNFSWSKRLRGGRPGDLNAWETFKSALIAILR